MAAASREQEIRQAWQALDEATAEQTDGWKTIALSPSDLNIRAGVRFPEREEAILAGFANVAPIGELPMGRGFHVVEIVVEQAESNQRWFGLSRFPGADPSMFLLMVLDVLSVLRSADSDSVRLHKFMQRVRAWQIFMEKHHDSVLGHEAEIGLHGELVVLELLLQNGLAKSQAISGWHGPEGGLHDFVFGQTAVEVKTTSAASGFPVQIGSLEQLDDATGFTIYLAGVRIGLQESGQTLPERIAAVRILLSPDNMAEIAFSTRLVYAGYFESAADKYSRRFSVADCRLVPVTSNFPKLVRSEIPLAIRQAAYEVDLELVNVPTRRLQELPEILEAGNQ